MIITPDPTGPMPDYEPEPRCILNGMFQPGAIEPDGITLCGREPHSFEWTFQDPTHAVCSGIQGTRVQACEKCVDAAVIGLKKLL